MNVKKKNKMRLPSPLFSWFHGWVNGRTGTAQVDSDGVLQSGYIQQFSNKYSAYSARELANLDSQLHNFIAEAEKLLLMVSKDTVFSVNESQVNLEGLSLSEKQVERAKIKKRSEDRMAQKSRHQVTIEKLIDLEHKIKKLQEDYLVSMLEVAKDLDSIFATYAKGVMWRKPLTENILPTVNTNTQAVQLYESWNLSENVLKKIQEVTKENEEKK